jgi:Tubulin like
VDHRFTVEDYGWLALDTAREELESAIEGDGWQRLPVESAIYLPVQNPQTYRKCDPEVFTPLSRRWLYNIPKSLRTDGVRPIATLALIAHYAPLLRILEAKLLNLVKLHQADESCHSPLRIYLAGSLHGGTGSSLIPEIGLMIRRIFSKHSFTNYRCSAVMCAGTTTNNQAGANLRSANAIASLSELTYLMDQSRDKPNLDYRGGLTTSNQTPFDWLTLVDGGALEDRKAAGLAAKQLARAISIDCQSLCGVALSDVRQLKFSETNGWLRTNCSYSIQEASASTPETISALCAIDVLDNIHKFLTGTSVTQPEELASQSNERSGSSSSLSTVLNKASLEEIAGRILRDAGLLMDSLPEPDELTAWSHRLNGPSEHREHQIVTDLKNWTNSLARQVGTRAFHWKQIERIQLQTVQRILDVVDSQLPTIVNQLSQFSSLFPKRLDLLQEAKNYFNELTRSCIQHLELTRNSIKQFSAKISHWRQALANRKGTIGLDGTKSLRGVSAQTKVLIEKVCGQVEDSFMAVILKLISQSAQANYIDAGNLRIQSYIDEVDLLRHTFGQVEQQCKLMGLDPLDLQCRIYHYSTVSYDQLQSLVPPLADRGGEVMRMIVTTADELPLIKETLDKQGISAKTTIIPGNSCISTQIVCDAGGICLAHLVAGLWRPSGATLSLAERLRTRVDIEWPDASQVLSINSPNMNQTEPTNQAEKQIANHSKSIPVASEINLTSTQGMQSAN